MKQNKVSDAIKFSQQLLTSEGKPINVSYWAKRIYSNGHEEPVMELFVSEPIAKMIEKSQAKKDTPLIAKLKKQKHNGSKNKI